MEQGDYDMISGSTATETWRMLLDNILGRGTMTYPRGFKCLELLNVTTVFPMHKPIVTTTARELGYKFLFAEAFWILTGDNRVETIKPFSKRIAEFSDDGSIFFGAYGPKIYDQLTYVVNKLKEDKGTRQAVLTIWRENPPVSKDIPCTISVQWLIRNNCLHCIDTMRSSDAWLGWPYDVFNFTMVTSFIMLHLREVYPELHLGNLFMNLGSSHLYDTNLVKAKVCVDDCSKKFNYPLLEPFVEFKDPCDLLWHLKCVSSGFYKGLKSKWVHCVARGDHDKKGSANAKM